MHLKISLPSLFIIALLLSFSGASAMAKTLEVAAWIESANPSDALTPRNARTKAKIVIIRQGQPLELNTLAVMTELKSGDRILINDINAYLNILTSTGRFQVTAVMAKKGGYEINASTNSLWDNLVALVADKIKPGQNQVISASSRGVPWLQAESAPTIPADQAQNSKLTAGERALHFRWQGGKPPYHLSLERKDQVLGEVNVIKSSEASLLKLALPPGSYKLVLKDKKGLDQDAHAINGYGTVTANLILVDAAEVPPMPSALAAALLPKEVRQLLYADWLARQGEGEWRMEAIQQIFPYAKTYEPAASWLRQWGGQ